MPDTAPTATPAWWSWLQPWTLPASATPSPLPWWNGGTAQLAPQQLVQPINPGWSWLSVNHYNSTAPAVERAIVERHSYGRQIGRMMEALAALLEQAPAALRGDARVKAFAEVAQEVAQIKQRAERPQLERLREELEALRRDDPAGWQALAQALAR